MRKYRVGLFHKIIIAFICCVALGGCGFKAAPYWEEPTSQSSKK